MAIITAAVVDAGVVTNLIQIDSASIGLIPGATVIPANVSPQIGWSYSSSAAFSPPVPTLAAAQAAQSSKLTVACQAAIVGGFTSSALGSAHIYPSSQTDQINLLGSVSDAQLNATTANWTTPFWCEDSAGLWGFRQHTAAQMIQVGQDGKSHVVACQTQLATLAAEVQAAMTVAAVQAIVWTNP